MKKININIHKVSGIMFTLAAILFLISAIMKRANGEDYTMRAVCVCLDVLCAYLNFRME